MLFRAAQYEAIGRGELTCAFRRWKRPTVRAGGTLITPVGVLAIDEVTVVDEADITDAEAQAAGHAGAAALLVDLGHPDRPLYRVRFHVGGEDPRIALRAAADLDDATIEQLTTKLARLDVTAKDGAWTTIVLSLIAAHPARRAGDLADALHQERLPFKQRVRSLKALGLTESLEVGYRISPRGAALLARLPPVDAPYARLMARTEKLELDVAGRTVSVSSPTKVFFPTRGETKLDLVNYYLAVGEQLMHAIGGRPLLLERYPDGAGGKSFFQKRVPESRPDWLDTTIVSTPNGTESEALVATDLAHVVWAVNLGSIGMHVWPYLAADAAHADELRIDLDPQPGITFEHVREAARETKALLDELGIASYAKTTGSRGIHIYARLLPEWDSYNVRAAAVAAARELERRRPDLLTAAWWKEERGTRVFIDFNQNAPHKTVFGAWSVRPRVGAQVSTPFAWDELDTVTPEQLTIVTVPSRVEANGDPWAAYPEQPQDLEPLLELARRDAEAGLLDAPWPPVYPKMPNEPPRVAPSRAKKPD